ncbi:MAG: hypothetical protein ABS939_00060 [Psychrobacillus sp.]
MDIPINMDGTLLTVIKVIQMVLVPIFGMMTLMGIFLFLYAFKNPFKKRIAFLLCVLSPIGFLFFLHGMVLIVAYVYNDPSLNPAGMGIEIFVTWVQAWQSPVYEVFKLLIQPLLAAVFIIGIVVLRHGAGIPARERMATWILAGTPFLWVLVILGPDIYRIFTS